MKTYEITNIPKFLHLFFWGGGFLAVLKQRHSLTLSGVQCARVESKVGRERLAKAHLKSFARSACYRWISDMMVDIFSRVLKDRRTSNNYWRE